MTGKTSAFPLPFGTADHYDNVFFGSAMSVSTNLAAEVLAKCARHCCICWRFRPLHLQVHHIIERNEGGTDDLDNLIAICVSCHSDVHTETKLTRRFSAKELKLHRDKLYQLVVEGKFPSGNETDDAINALSAAIVQRLLTTLPPQPITRPPLSTEAVKILLAAVAENAPINIVRYDGGMAFCTGGKSFGEAYDLSSSALYRNAVNQLMSSKLVDGGQEQLFASQLGYLVADEILYCASRVVVKRSDRSPKVLARRSKC